MQKQAILDTSGPETKREMIELKEMVDEDVEEQVTEKAPPVCSTTEKTNEDDESVVEIEKSPIKEGRTASPQGLLMEEEQQQQNQMSVGPSGGDQYQSPEFLRSIAEDISSTLEEEIRKERTSKLLQLKALREEAASKYAMSGASQAAQINLPYLNINEAPIVHNDPVVHNNATAKFVTPTDVEKETVSLSTYAGLCRPCNEE